VDTDRAAIDKVLKTKLNSGKSSRLANAIAAAPISSRHAGGHASYRFDHGWRQCAWRTSHNDECSETTEFDAVSVHIVSYTVLRGRLCKLKQSDRGGDGVQRDANPASNPWLTAILRCRRNTRTPGFK